MGHSHQNPMWTFAGTGEVTVNIFTVLALHTVNGYPLDNAAMRTEPGRAFATMVKHAGRHRSTSGARPVPRAADLRPALAGIRLGGLPHRLPRYDDSPRASDRTDDEKRDRFAITMSQTVERNLAPYFEGGVSPSQERSKKPSATSGLDARGLGRVQLTPPVARVRSSDAPAGRSSRVAARRARDAQHRRHHDIQRHRIRARREAV